mgnify:FL=1
MAKYSVSQWIYGREPLEHSLDRLARYGYQGVELAGEPGELEPARVRRLLADRGLVASSICGLYPPKRDLSHPDGELRRWAVHYVKSCCELAAAVEAPTVIVVPSPVGRTAPVADARTELELAAESLREAGEHAAGLGVTLVIEALNRFETYLINKLEQAVELARRVGLPNVAVMADTFHMNIEEPSIAGSIRRAGDLIRHVHIADSNRESVGRGHIDFAEVLRALRDVGYDGWLTMEFLPPVSNPYLAADRQDREGVMDLYTGECIERLREIEANLGKSVNL